MNAAYYVLAEDGVFQTPGTHGPGQTGGGGHSRNLPGLTGLGTCYVRRSGRLGPGREVARYPLRLTKAVHAGKANLTCGGGAHIPDAPAGGINFIVDVEQIRQGAFCWVPTPATVAPIEYTMRTADYEAMGGHTQAVKPFKTKEPRPWNRSGS